MKWLGENEIPFIRIFSKCDKINQNEIKNKILDHRESLLEHWEELPEHILSSSRKKIGKKIILEKIEKMNQLLR